jgi:anti-sigma factor RsiW
MNSRECFKNDMELCYYLDGEIFGVRENDLDNHITICPRCFDQLLVWRNIKILVRDSISHVRAPAHVRERMDLLFAETPGIEGSPGLEKKTTKRSEHLNDHSRSHEGFSREVIFGFPFSAAERLHEDRFRKRPSDGDKRIDNY